MDYFYYQKKSVFIYQWLDTNSTNKESIIDYKIIGIVWLFYFLFKFKNNFGIQIFLLFDWGSSVIKD